MEIALTLKDYFGYSMHNVTLKLCYNNLIQYNNKNLTVVTVQQTWQLLHHAKTLVTSHELSTTILSSFHRTTKPASC